MMQSAAWIPLLFLLASPLLVLVVMILRLRRRLVSASAEMELLKEELRLATAASSRLAARLRRLEQRGLRLEERVDRLASEGARPGVDELIGAVQRGTGPEQLVEYYGLTRGEADLLAALHGRRAD